MDLVETFSISMAPDIARELRAGIESGEFASTSEAVSVALCAWQRARREEADCVEALRARIRRSIDDPRPNISAQDLDAQLAALFAKTDGPGGHAAS